MHTVDVIMHIEIPTNCRNIHVQGAGNYHPDPELTSVTYVI